MPCFGDNLGHALHAQVGLGICYDVRFPELAQMYRRHGCELLVYPGAFNMTTGTDRIAVPTFWRHLWPGHPSPEWSSRPRLRAVWSLHTTRCTRTRVHKRASRVCARAFVCGLYTCATMYVLYPTHTTHDRPDPTLCLDPSARQGRRIGSF